MDPRAVEQSKARLLRVRSAIGILNTNPEFSNYAEAWLDFLTAASAIFSKLEEGAKVSGKSGGWFGRIKHLRKSDPVLSYVHHARNAEQHGIIPSTTRHPGKALRIKANEFIEPIDDAKAWREDGAISGRIIKVPETGKFRVETEYVDVEYVELVTVKDTRYRDRFNPPAFTDANGRAHRLTPMQVAIETLAHLETIIAEAEALVE